MIIKNISFGAFNIQTSLLLWPLPAAIPIPSTQFRPFNAKFAISTCQGLDQACKIVSRAIARTNKAAASRCPGLVSFSTQIDIAIVISGNTIPTPESLLGISEKYSIDSTQKEVAINADSFVGAVYALHSLSQLVVKFDGKCLLNSAKIVDKPRFSHRGLLLDTSRNYFTVDDIKRRIDGMAYSKLNVFHWHVYDSQSFPLAWENDNGKIYKLSAYKGKTGKLKIYTKKDIKGIVIYALERGIRVIPEFDMPGHTTPFSNAYPELVKCANFSPFDGGKADGSAWLKRRCNQPSCGQLDPKQPKTYELINAFLKDMATWFPDLYVHLGMDEVNAMCWDAPKNDLNLITDQMVDFSQKIVDIALKNKKKVVVWDEAVISYSLSSSAELFGKSVLLPSNTIIQVWEGLKYGNIDITGSTILLKNKGIDDIQTTINLVSQIGYKTIVSPSSSWYLDCGPQVPWCASKNAAGKDVWHDWKKMYNYEPIFNVKKPENILGGEGAAWSETIKQHELDYIVWPRMAAIAERLWSKASTKIDDKTEVRLSRFRATLVNELGIGASEVWNGVGKTDRIYRVEWCDFNLDSLAQKSRDVYVGMTRNNETLLDDYCAIAGEYKTEELVYSFPKAVSYNF